MGKKTSISRGALKWTKKLAKFSRDGTKNSEKHRFGNLSPVYEQKINLADSETLLYWRERILAAKTPEDVFI